VAHAFDIGAYSRTAAPVTDADLDYGAFAHRPLSPGALRCLRYMCDIESHTVCYLRDLLVTPSHADREVTTFLTMWTYEEYWHGEVLAKVLDAHGIPTGNSHIRGLREGLGWRDRMAPIWQALAANLVGTDFVADHPVLTELLARIMRQETRHVAFYVSQARDRLATSRRAQRLTRFALRRFWEPVGSGVMPRAETRHLLRFLFAGQGAGSSPFDRIDDRIHRLPGLAGLRLLRRAATAYGISGS
jgi:hypothetical protein